MSCSPIFRNLVSALKRHKKTVAVVESSCGGLISAGILAQPGASAVYHGGTVAYNTGRCRPLLLNDAALHARLLENRKRIETAENYVASKVYWTRETSIAYCQALGVDYCIAEGGATGPTFHYGDLSSGFAAISVAAASAGGDGPPKVVRHRVVHSAHANRSGNMALFAETAAEIALQVILEQEGGHCPSEDADDSLMAGEPVSSAAEASADNEEDRLPPRPPSSVPSLQLDRATHLRSQADVVERLAESPQARYVALHSKRSLFRIAAASSGVEQRELAFLSRSELFRLCRHTEWTPHTSFLGLLVDRSSPPLDNNQSPLEALDLLQPVFGVDLTGEGHDHHEGDDTASTLSHLWSQGVVWEDTRTAAPFLAPLSNEVVLYATALAEWQRRSSHCPTCGTPTALEESGHRRRCQSCGSPSWPRQDPSMIAAVSSHDGSHLLLARSARHPPKVHTALAGFVEAGETFERAVEREVWEEVAVRVDPASIRYVASQPWPFPQSAMVGFSARVAEPADGNLTPSLRLQANEVSEAGWFTRDQVRAAAAVPGPVMQHAYALDYLSKHPGTELLLPPRGVLARRLIEAWLDEAE